MNKLFKKTMKSQHRGFGGMIFLIVSSVSAITMLYVASLSWTSNAVAMADNVAYISTVQAANNLYLGNVQSFRLENTTNKITTQNGYTIDPIGQYTSILKSTGIMKANSPMPTHYTIKWDASKRTAAIQYEGFETNLGSMINPHIQSAVIENN